MSNGVADPNHWFSHVRGTYHELQLRETETLPRWAYAAFYPIKIAIRAVEEFQRNHGLTRASGLAFTTLLALVPLSVVVFQLLRSTAVFAELQQGALDMVFSYILPAKAEEVQGLLVGTVGARSSELTPFAWGLLLVTCFLLLNTIESTFNAIWGVRRARPLNRRIIAYWTVLTMPALLISLSFYFSLQAQGWLRETMGSVPIVYKGSMYLLTIIPTWLGFACAYLFVPYTTVRPRAAFVGGIVAGTMWDLGKLAYLEYSRTAFSNIETLYGTLATIPLTLIWIYMSWLVVIFGAEIAFAVQFPDSPASAQSQSRAAQRAFREYYAVRVMAAIVRHYMAGTADTPTSPALATELQTPPDVLLPLLDDLRQNGLILLSEDETWVPARPPDTITVQHVATAAGDRQYAVPDHARDAVTDVVREHFTHVQEQMQAHLGTLTMTELAQQDTAG